MTKFIVKNCPAIKSGKGVKIEEKKVILFGKKLFCAEKDCIPYIECQHRSDCLTKRVIEKCKLTLSECEDCLSKDKEGNYICFECENANARSRAEEILNMFEIEEIKE